MSEKGKLSKMRLALVISVSTVLVFVSAILITNIFIPVKYMSAYINPGSDKPALGEMRISFLDVGNSDCTVLELPDGKVALIDGGSGSYSSQISIFKKLNSCGIDKIDYLFCTSSASRLCGGLAEIVRYKKIGKIYAPLCTSDKITVAYRNFRKEAENKNIHINNFSYGAGEYNEEYGYRICVLYSKECSADSEYDEVCSSAVWISYGGVKVLLLGVLSSSELDNFHNTYTDVGFEVAGDEIYLEECNIVKVANGGDRSSKCALIYDLLQAETAIISTSGEPDISVISDIESFAGDNIYRTDKNGTVTLNISDGKYSIKKER